MLLPSAGAIEEGVPVIRNFVPGQYEGGSNIYSVVCNREGLLFAGDNYGINVYDGENWSRIETGFAVSSLAAGSDNTIYVAGAGGIGKLVPAPDLSLSYHSLDNYVSPGKTSLSFGYSKVFNISNRIIFVLGNQIVVSADDNIRIIDSSHEFTYCQKLNEELYLYSPGNGIFRLEETKPVLLNESERVRNTEIKGFLHINNVLYGLASNGQLIQVDYSGSTQFHAGTMGLAVSGIWGSDQINDSTYVIRTRDRGFVLIDNKGDITESYNYQEGLVNNTIHTVFRDYWNNLWVGTAAGISSLRLDLPFSRFNDLYGIGTGHASIEYDQKYYFATSRGLYYRAEERSGLAVFRGLYEGEVYWLSVIDGTLYFGSSTGIYFVDGDNSRRIAPYPSSGKLTAAPPGEGLYLAGSNRGIVALEKGPGGKLQFAGLVEGIVADVTDLETEESGVIWAATGNGAYRFLMDNSRLEVSGLQKFEKIDPDNKIRRIFRLRDRVHFIADSGIYRYEAEGLFRIDTAFNKLYTTGGRPSCIVVDETEQLWVFTDGKLSSYLFDRGRLLKQFNPLLDYANDTYPTGRENIYNPDGNIAIIGQEEGFLGYHIGKKGHTTYSSNGVRRVVVTSRKGNVRNASMQSEFANGVQNYKAIEGIPYGSSVKFYFSAGCSKYGGVKYSTFLEGFDNRWPEWNDENFKEYTNLPAGNYMFIIRSVNKSNEESYPAIFSFTIIPAWYNTIAARVIYAVLAVLLILVIIKLINARIRKLSLKAEKEREEQLYRKEQQRIKEDLLKQQEIIKLRNEKLRIDNLYKSCELANATMGVMKKNQLLTGLKSELESIKERMSQNIDVSGEVRSLIRKIDNDIDNEESWKVFEDHFDMVHERFISRLKAKYPFVTPNDLRLAAFLRMNLSTKEIAPLLNITVRGVEISRYRLRKKLGLGRNDNLNDFLLKF